MTPEQALNTLTLLVCDDRLRFLNRKEYSILDEALQILKEAIEPKTSKEKKR